MFKINRKIEYALIALKHMSQKFPGQLTSAKEICETFKLPFDPTSRVLQIMNQHNIVRAEQGAHGGYQITKDLSKITLKELTDILIGPIELTDCRHDVATGCETKNCGIQASMGLLNERLNDLLETFSVAELIEIKPRAKLLPTQ